MSAHALTQPLSCTASPRADAVAEFLALGAAVAAIPVFFHDSQLFAGTAVNAALALGALRLSCPWRRATLVVVPAVAAVSASRILGDFTAGLLLLVPAIWLSNAVYMALIARGRRIATALPLAALAKAALLLAATGALVAAGLLPKAFVTVMAPIAFATALLGGALGAGIDRLLRRGVAQ